MKRASVRCMGGFRLRAGEWKLLGTEVAHFRNKYFSVTHLWRIFLSYFAAAFYFDCPCFAVVCRVLPGSGFLSLTILGVPFSCVLKKSFLARGLHAKPVFPSEKHCLDVGTPSSAPGRRSSGC